LKRKDYRLPRVIEQLQRTGVPGAARLLGCTENTVRKYADNGTLPVERDYAGRRQFLVSDLTVFVQSRRTIAE
jgi:hypothetical protein